MSQHCSAYQVSLKVYAVREFGSTFRCDRFTNVKEGEESPLYYLLSHIHSDHLVGLQRKSFTGQIFCSEITRDLLLRLEPATQRIFFNTGFIDKKCRPYYSLGSKKGVKFVVLKVNEPHILRVSSCCVWKDLH